MLRALACLSLVGFAASSAIAQGVVVGMRSGNPIPMDDVRGCVAVWSSQKEQMLAEGRAFPSTLQAKLDAWTLELSTRTSTTGEALVAEIDASMKLAQADWSTGKAEPVTVAPRYAIGHCMGMERVAPKPAQ